MLTAPTPDTSLLQALGQTAASQQDFDTSLTGADAARLADHKRSEHRQPARADALKTTKDLPSQAMATVGNIAGAMLAGNPNAGSSALRRR